MSQTARTPLLMSAENPNGYKLEELLDQLRDELVAKNDRLRRSEENVVARHVRAFNQGILRRLSEAQDIQNLIQRMLATIGPDQGPTGVPRV